MAMDETVYEYAVLRYVPDVERGEFVNVGLLMMCKRYRWLRVALNVDGERLRALFPKGDIETLRRQLEVFRRDDVPRRDLPVEERYRWMAAVKSAIIQTSPSHPGIIPPCDDDPKERLQREFDSIYASMIK